MSAYSDAVLADTPFTYIRMTETSGTTFSDLSGNGHTATAVNGSTAIVTNASLITSDAANPAAKFDWATTLRQADTAVTDIGSTAMTAELWIQVASFAGDPAATGYYNGTPGGFGAVNLFLGSSGTSDSDGWHLGFQRSNGQIYVGMPGAIEVLLPGFTFSIAVTYHIVITWDLSNNANLYVNGSFVSATAVGAMVPTTGPLTINNGVPGTNSNPRSNSVIDEVATYSGALSAVRVAAHWNAAFPSVAGVNFLRKGDRRA